MEVIVRRQDREHCASITCMIRHYVARRAKVIEDHPHNAAYGAAGLLRFGGIDGSAPLWEVISEGMDAEWAGSVLQSIP